MVNCTVNNSDGDMISCDVCKCWLHTVCCGFYSNGDKRLVGNKFVCHMCRNTFTLETRNLALERRIISILYNENIKTLKCLEGRLRMSHNAVMCIIKRLDRLGLVNVTGDEISTLKDDTARNAIKKYFDPENSVLEVEIK